MKKQYRTQLVRQIGEHLVVSKLGRMGIIATPFAGNVPDYDILASDTEGKSIPIQVKAIRSSSWQFSITSFLSVEVKTTKQIVLGKVKLTNSNLVCVFVRLWKDKPDEFYILKLRDIQNHFFKNYKGRIKPKNIHSFHCAIWPSEIEKFRDNWGLITKHLEPEPDVI
jgi:hypothetical protein